MSFELPPELPPAWRAYAYLGSEVDLVSPELSPENGMPAVTVGHRLIQPPIPHGLLITAVVAPSLRHMANTAICKCGDGDKLHASF